MSVKSMKKVRRRPSLMEFDVDGGNASVMLPKKFVTKVRNKNVEFRYVPFMGAFVGAKWNSKRTEARMYSLHPYFRSRKLSVKNAGSGAEAIDFMFSGDTGKLARVFGLKLFYKPVPDGGHRGGALFAYKR